MSINLLLNPNNYNVYTQNLVIGDNFAIIGNSTEPTNITTQQLASAVANSNTASYQFNMNIDLLNIGPQQINFSIPNRSDFYLQSMMIILDSQSDYDGVTGAVFSLGSGSTWSGSNVLDNTNIPNSLGDTLTDSGSMFVNLFFPEPINSVPNTDFLYFNVISAPSSATQFSISVIVSGYVLIGLKQQQQRIIVL